MYTIPIPKMKCALDLSPVGKDKHNVCRFYELVSRCCQLILTSNTAPAMASMQKAIGEASYLKGT